MNRYINVFNPLYANSGNRCAWRKKLQTPSVLARQYPLEGNSNLRLLLGRFLILGIL